SPRRRWRTARRRGPPVVAVEVDLCGQRRCLLSMSSRWAIALLAAGTVALAPAPPAVRTFPATAARSIYDRGLDSLDARLAALAAAIGQPDSAATRIAFRSARSAY